MMTKEGSTKIVNFTNPVSGVLMLGCGHISHEKAPKFTSHKKTPLFPVYIQLHP